MSQTAVVTFRAAKETEYAGFLDLIHQHAADYLEPSLTLLGLDKTEFAHLFRTRGQVVSILADRAVAGFYWIEERDGTLHIHGLVIKPEFQKRGLAAAALAHLETGASPDVARFELGVHRANGRARKIYERAGYRVTRALPDFDFSIMHKDRPAQS